MPVFLSIVIVVIVGTYGYLYTEVAQRMPFGNANATVLVWGPMILFVVAVLIALIYLTAKIGRLARIIDDQRPLQ